MHSEWVDAAEDRELKYHQRNHILAEEYNRHTRSLKPLSGGTHVLIQGKDKRWNRQGEVVECLNNRQYRIRLLGSGRVTLRNRRFIKPCHQTKPTLQLYSSEDLHNSTDTDLSQENSSINESNPSNDGVTHNESGQDTSIGNSGRQIAPAPKPPRTPRALRILRSYNNRGLKE